jgi:hypothetical protein
MVKNFKWKNLKNENLLVVSKKLKRPTSSTSSSIGTPLINCLIGQHMLQYAALINEQRK